jgi:hypothetical protein
VIQTLSKFCIDSSIEISLSQVLRESSQWQAMVLAIQNIELPDMDVKLPMEETPGSGSEMA